MLKLDDSGDIQIPQNYLSELGWNENTPLSVTLNDDGNIIIKAKTEWEFEDFEKNFDIILEDTIINKVVHKIHKDGNLFVLAPAAEEEQQLLEKGKENE